MAPVLVLLGALFASGPVEAGAGLFERSSEHFLIVYRESHSHFVPHILTSAESSLARLMEIFDYTPTERITLITFDTTDHGTGAATTIPQNLIRLEIEPLAIDYESTPFHDRFQWLLNHELVHIVVNDLPKGAEKAGRSLFSKVSPDPARPLTIGYSLLTGASRFTPRWHQEGIAAFMETWLSGGFGRALGSFDEMYFRSLVAEGQPLSDPDVLVARDSKSTFLLGGLHYLYGTRFCSYLAATHGTERLVAWYRRLASGSLDGHRESFRKTFGVELEAAWQRWVATERRAQAANLAAIRRAEPTPIERLTDEPQGWVTRPHLDPAAKRVIYGTHRPHHLAAMTAIDLERRKLENLGTLETPSFLQVASTAVDRNLGLLFYTTNNSKLYRDLWVRDLETSKTRRLFEDARVGELTVSATTHELWAVRHSQGVSSLVRSPYPYTDLESTVHLSPESSLHHLAASPTGRYLAATLHSADGSQAIVVAEVEALRESKRFSFRVITDEGTPEHPSWSPDEGKLFWNAYTNGVSNIYRYDRRTGKVEPMSHTEKGLFQPLWVSAGSLFAFEFTTAGFIPVLVPNRVAERLPAIDYYGQQVIDRNPEVIGWQLERPELPQSMEPETAYGGLANLRLQTLAPSISGFQGRRVLGAYVRAADPLGIHQIEVEVGVSPLEGLDETEFHLNAVWKYRRKYRFELAHNGPEFYDLVNDRKTGVVGNRFTFGHEHYWKYDMPHQIKQTSEVSLFTGIEAVADNQIPVSSSLLLTLDSTLESQRLRRAIGSVDYEQGSRWAISFLGMAENPVSPRLAAGLVAEWDRYLTVGPAHNVLHLQFAGGFLAAADKMAVGRFYFGGFGNRMFEMAGPKQYRDVFRFPGLPLASVSAQRFGKVMLEHGLPPLRFSDVRLGRHHLEHLEVSWFTQGLVSDSPQGRELINLGAQVNLVFNHWSNLESTLSLGVAQAWHPEGPTRKWFASLKLLKS